MNQPTSVQSSNEGYHLTPIEKGTLGEVSKIQEEFNEFLDAYRQGCNIMSLLELSDLIGAVESYIEKYNMTLEDLLQMSRITKRAFRNGDRA